MDMIPVQSSNIAAAGYNAATKTMDVQFKNGSRYSYADVPQDVFDDFLSADSKGQFFNTNIKSRFVPTKATGKAS